MMIDLTYREAMSALRDALYQQEWREQVDLGDYDYPLPPFRSSFGRWLSTWNYLGYIMLGSTFMAGAIIVASWIASR